MTFTVYVRPDKELFSCTFFYNTGKPVANLRTSHFRLNSDCTSIGFSTYRKNSTTLLINHSMGLLSTANQCKLEYPLQEEQVFQELTRFPVPLESDMDLFMSTGAYVMEGIDNFIAYSFNAGWIAEEQIDETSKENMVQSVQEVLDGLIQVEKDRIDARDEEWGKWLERECIAKLEMINKSSP
jgi:hypothetical protein